MQSPDQVALLALATRLAAPVVLVVTAFQIAWVPFSLSIARQSAAGHVYARTLSYFLAATLGVLLLLVVLREPLILLFSTPAYLPAGQVLAIVGSSIIAYGAYYIVATGVNLAGQTAHIGWTTVVAAIVSITLNLLLIPVLGFAGAATAGLAANLTAVALLYTVAQRVYPLPYNLPQVSLLAAAGAACMGLATLVHTGDLIVDLLLRVCVLAGFALALASLGVVRSAHLREAARLMRGVLGRTGTRP
jgi:O-antigen/teichoic acid export membrane protein